MEELLVLREVGKMLAWSEALLRKWIHQGKLPSVKVGRLTRIRPQDLEKVLGVGPGMPTKEEDHHE